MEHAFKAENVTFREGNYEKVGKVDFHVFLRREFAFKIHPGSLWKIRKTLTLGDSYAIRDFPGSFCAPDCTKRIYSVSWKVFRHRIEVNLIKIMEFDNLFLSREISFPFPKK